MQVKKFPKRDGFSVDQIVCGYAKLKTKTFQYPDH